MSAFISTFQTAPLLVRMKYVCRNCNHGFLGYDKEVLALLPPMVSRQLDVVLSHKAGYSRAMARFIGKACVSGLSMKKFASLVNETMAEDYDRVRLCYYEYLSWKASLKIVPLPL